MDTLSLPIFDDAHRNLFKVVQQLCADRLAPLASGELEDLHSAAIEYVALLGQEGLFDPGIGRALEGEAPRPDLRALAVVRSLALPPPMLPGVAPLPADQCLLGHAFKAAVVPGSLKGFQWDDTGTPQRPEIRACTWTAGSQMVVQLDTRLKPDGGGGGGAVNATHTAVLLWYTHSYHWVGRGRATCGNGCACAPQLLYTAIKSTFGTQVWVWRCCCTCPATHALYAVQAACCLVAVPLSLTLPCRRPHTMRTNRTICIPYWSPGQRRAASQSPRWRTQTPAGASSCVCSALR